MRQEQTEKQIIEQLKRISIPAPDAEFEHALRTKFIKQASRKHRSSRVMRRLNWVGGFAAVAILGFLLINGNLLPQYDEFADQINVVENNVETGAEQQQGIMSINGVEGTIGVSKRIILGEGEQVPITDANLSEVYNYIEGPKGIWRFYQDEGYHQLYISKDQEHASLIYQVSEGYVNSHIYPNPVDENEYLLAIIESNDTSSFYRFFHMNAQGQLDEIEGIQQSGYTSIRLNWSPNGKQALVHAENHANRTTFVGVIDEDLHYRTLYGEIDPEADTMVTGTPDVSFVIWLSDEAVLVFNNDAKAFMKYSLDDDEVRSFTVSVPNGQSENVFNLYPTGNEQWAILQAGIRRLDVGFEPSHRLYLVDVAQGLMEPIESEPQHDVLAKMQDYFGTTNEGDLIITDIYQNDDASFQLSFRLLDPESKKVSWHHEQSFSRLISNPQAVFSPDRTKVAIKFYSEEYGTGDDGTAFYMSAPYYFLFFDLENQKVAEMELDEYELPTWLDNNTVQIGEQTFNLTK